MPSRSGIENFKQIAEKFKKLENTIIASFQVKIGRERPRKRENKKNHSDGFFTRPGIENSKKNSKKIQKFRKHHHCFFSCQNKLGKAEKWKK